MQWNQSAKGWAWLFVNVLTSGLAGIPMIIDYWMCYAAQQKRSLGPWEWFPTNISILIALIFSLPGILIAGFVGVVPLPKMLFNAWFGFRCPSCGTTSALRMLVLDNNLIASFKLQPFCLVLAVFVVLVVS